jgi:uncharacterized protein DUF6894
MSHFYFHLTMDDEYVPDRAGQKFADLAAAHSHAVLTASRVMSFCEVEHRTPRTKRLVVTIEDETGRVLMSVIIRCESANCDVRRVPPRISRLAFRSC